MERDFRGGNGMNVDHIATYDEDAAAAIKETLTEGAEATVDYTEERNAFIQKVLEAAFFAIRERNENVHELRWRWAGPEKEGSIDIIMVGPPGVNPCRDHVDDYATIGHCLKDAHFSVNIVLGWEGVSETPPLGDRIRARRVGRGMTLAAVAESAGLSLPYVSNLERGRGNPTLEALQAIARALDMPLSELVADREEHVGGDLVLAQAPASLLQFARSPRFQSAVQRLASEHSCSAEDMRQRLLVGMVSAPRRGSGEPTEEDWRRLLDVYTVILADE